MDTKFDAPIKMTFGI
jgi:hypothetical protein